VNRQSKFTGLILASGVRNGDPATIILEQLEAFSVIVLSSDLLFVRDRYIFTLLIEISPDHAQAISDELDLITQGGEVDVAYEFTPFAAPESESERRNSRYECVIIGSDIRLAALSALQKLLTSYSSIDAFKLFNEHGYTVARFTFSITEAEASEVLLKLRELANSEALAINLFSVSQHTTGNELVILDMDSTFINEEVIDEIAALAGVGSQVAAITESAMRGELDFAQSLMARTALLAGKPATLIDDARARISLTRGAEDLVRALHAKGARVGIVSGGFHDVIDEFLAPLDLDFVVANSFEIEDGLFTGAILGEIVDAKVKARTLLTSRGESVRTIAIGDGANDIELLKAADLGIAFCAKDALTAKANISLNHRDLRAVLPLLGY